MVLFFLVTCAAGFIGVLLWKLAQANSAMAGMHPDILVDPRFIKGQRGLRRRNADPFDITIQSGGWGQQPNREGYPYRIEAFVLVADTCPLGSRNKLTLVPGTPPSPRARGRPDVTSWDAVTTAEREAWRLPQGSTSIDGRYGGIFIGGKAAGMERGVLDRDDVEAAFVSLLANSGCFGVQFEHNHMRVAFRRQPGVITDSSRLVTLMEQVEQLAAVVIPACQQAGLVVRSLPWGPGSIGADGGAPVSSGLRR